MIKADDLRPTVLYFQCPDCIATMRVEGTPYDTVWCPHCRALTKMYPIVSSLRNKQTLQEALAPLIAILEKQTPLADPAQQDSDMAGPALKVKQWQTIVQAYYHCFPKDSCSRHTHGPGPEGWKGSNG